MKCGVKTTLGLFIIHFPQTLTLSSHVMTR
jgi:hypothetical protein